jgi:hypothetical protein
MSLEPGTIARFHWVRLLGYAACVLKRRATIQRGQLVLERPVELPEGSVVEITIAEGDEDLDLSDAELEERDAFLAAGLAEVMRGDGVDARELVAHARQRR